MRLAPLGPRCYYTEAYGYKTTLAGSKGHTMQRVRYVISMPHWYRALHLNGSPGEGANLGPAN